MNKKNVHRMIQSLMLGACLVGTANAATYTEVGDTGDLVSTAQIPSGTGDLTHIYGMLEDFDGVEDVDLYRILITDPSQFSVAVASNLDADNDTMLWLFDADGRFVMMDDDAGGNYVPRFTPAHFVGGSAGVHYLGFSIFATAPQYTDGVLTGWNYDASPMQSGDYTLALTGVGLEAPSAVPVPAAAWLLGSGLVGLVGVARRKPRAAPL